ncbi:hypothetical protein Aduo_010419 [Ancylostoma duodenale]
MKFLVTALCVLIYSYTVVAAPRENKCGAPPAEIEGECENPTKYTYKDGYCQGVCGENGRKTKNLFDSEQECSDMCVIF